MSGWVSTGIPLVDSGGMFDTTKTGFPVEESTVLAATTATPMPWVYCEVRVHPAG